MEILGNILVATDLTKSSENLLENVMVLAKTFQSKISLLHILPDDIRNEKVRSFLKDNVMGQLKEFNERLRGEGLKTMEPMLKFGSTSDSIVQSAETLDANLIMIGAGEKLISGTYQMGTTAEKIISKSDRPVWVVKKDTPLHVKNILCPIDFSPESKRALKNAITLTRRFDAALTVFSVFEPFYSAVQSRKIDWDNENKYWFAEYQKEFDLFISDFNFTDLKWKKDIQSGDPSKEIISAIERYDSDLVLMGTTGKSGLKRLMMGSTTMKVLREAASNFVTMKTQDIINLRVEERIRDIESHFATAKQLMKDGFYKESINEYKVCLGINDMHIPSLYGLSEVYEKTGNVEDAGKYKKMASEILSKIWDRKIEAEIRKFYKL